MQTVSFTDFQRNPDRYQRLANREPLELTTDHRQSYIFITSEEYYARNTETNNFSEKSSLIEIMDEISR